MINKRFMKQEYYVHETSLIGDTAVIGRNTRIWQFCNIMNGVEIGNDCNIGQNVFVESGVRIGNHVKVKNNISIYQGVVCEDDVFLGPNCVFTNVINPRSFIEKKTQIKQTHIHKGATIGANATIVCGNHVGSYAMIGAGSVVTKNVGDYELVVGNPAKKIGYVCKCGETLKKEKETYYCKICDKQYHFVNGAMVCKEDKNGVY